MKHFWFELNEMIKGFVSKSLEMIFVINSDSEPFKKSSSIFIGYFNISSSLRFSVYDINKTAYTCHCCIMQLFNILLPWLRLLTKIYLFCKERSLHNKNLIELCFTNFISFYRRMNVKLSNKQHRQLHSTFNFVLVLWNIYKQELKYQKRYSL